MSCRFTLAAFAALFMTAAILPAAAQEHGFHPQPVIPQPPTKLPFVPHGDKKSDLDFLFGALKAAPDDETAKAVEQRIWAVWAISKSDTTNLLMSRARKAVEAKDPDLAIKLLSAIIKIKPNYVEGWNRRATLYYMKKEYGRALHDIGEVLTREPRHFGALSGLGLILSDIGDDKLALDAYRRALAVYPRLQRVPDLVKTLSQKVEGRDI
jgi:tetratricopeptide (TPR) repeat protein